MNQPVTPDSYSAETVQPAFVAAVDRAFQTASPPLRARLLERMLPHLRPLALVTLAAGVFAPLITRAHWSQVELPTEQLSNIQSDQVVSIASYVAQSGPALLAQLCTAFSEDFSSTPAMAAIFLAIALRALHARSH